jgi:hypothetical protein
MERLPSVESLMQPLSIADMADEANPPIAEQLLTPNALRQRRYRERLRNGNGQQTLQERHVTPTERRQARRPTGFRQSRRSDLPATDTAMSNAARIAETFVADAADTVRRFCAHCEATALRYAAGDLTLQCTVDVMQDYAVGFAIVEAIGQDAVQAIMADAIHAIADTADVHVAKSTLDAAEYLIRENDPKRLEAWLLNHSTAERAAIVAHIKRGPP